MLLSALLERKTLNIFLNADISVFTRLNALWFYSNFYYISQIHLNFCVKIVHKYLSEITKRILTKYVLPKR